MWQTQDQIVQTIRKHYTSAFVKARPEKHQQVGVIDQVAVGVAIGRDAEAAKRQGGALSHHALGLEAGGHRNIEAPGECRDEVARAGLNATVARDDDGMLRSAQQVGESLKGLRSTMG